MVITINDRIEALINKEFDGNKAAFAKRLGFPPTGMSSYFGKQRRSKPSLDMIIKIIEELNVDPRWLLLGEENSNTNSIHTEGDYSPAVYKGDVNVIKDVEIKDDFQASKLITENEKLSIENNMLKKLLEEKEKNIEEKEKNIQEKERLISFLTAKTQK